MSTPASSVPPSVSDSRPWRAPVLGTPLTSAAVRVLLLGSGELGKELTISLQRLGVEVIAADRYPNAPAHQVAHHARVLDMTDPVALRALIDAEAPDLVVPEIEAIATEVLVEVEARGVRVVPTALATRLTMDREGIRRLAAEDLGLPTSPYEFAATAAELAAAARRVGFPCVIKPVMSSSGKGQSVARGPADIAAAWATASAGGRVANSRVIVEGFVDFDFEITLLTVRAYGPNGIGTYFCEPIGHRQVDGDYVESWQPQPLSRAARESALSIAARVATALGGTGVFGVELFIKGDEVYFSEVSPRPHDTGMVTLATQRLSEFDLHARAILGLPVDVTLHSPGASAVIYAGVTAPAVSFAGVAVGLTQPRTDIRLFGKPDATPRRRFGVAVAAAETIALARERARTAAAAVIVSPAPDALAPKAMAPKAMVPKAMVPDALEPEAAPLSTAPAQSQTTSGSGDGVPIGDTSAAHNPGDSDLGGSHSAAGHGR